MKKIPLTQGKFALVDDEDFEELSKHKWYAAKQRTDNFYAVRYKKRRMIYMHRTLLCVQWEKHVDHKDGDGLNNMRSNIRICTQQENNRNKRISLTSVSGLKGVSLHKTTGKWVARIMVNMKSIHLGYFLNKNDAHEAYCVAAKKYHGEFANTG